MIAPLPHLAPAASLNKLLASRPALQILFSFHQLTVLVLVTIETLIFTLPFLTPCLCNPIPQPMDSSPFACHPATSHASYTSSLTLSNFLGFIATVPRLVVPGAYFMAMGHGPKSHPRGNRTMIGTNLRKEQSPHTSHHHCMQRIGWPRSC